MGTNRIRQALLPLLFCRFAVGYGVRWEINRHEIAFPVVPIVNL